jgi:hypothetical protein
MKDLVLYKNMMYGDSALHPLGIFCKAGATSSITVRLDDKLNRIKNAEELRKNDVADLIGYLALLCVSNGWLSFEEFKD